MTTLEEVLEVGPGEGVSWRSDQRHKCIRFLWTWPEVVLTMDLGALATCTPLPGTFCPLLSTYTVCSSWSKSKGFTWWDWLKSLFYDCLCLSSNLWKLQRWDQLRWSYLLSVLICLPINTFAGLIVSAYQSIDVVL